MKAKDKEFDRILAEYRAKYEVDSLENPNDISNLETMIRNQLLIEKLQDRLDTVANDNTIDPNEVKKILDSVVALSQTNMQYEKSLGIDRKTRKSSQLEDFPSYLVAIKTSARTFLDNRLIKLMCKTCEIMVGRIGPVYDTNEFSAAFQCPQCKKFTTVTRKEKDVFFDVKNADWRRKYPMEVIPAKRSKGPEIDVLNDVLLSNNGDDLEYDA